MSDLLLLLIKELVKYSNTIEASTVLLTSAFSEILVSLSIFDNINDAQD